MVFDRAPSAPRPRRLLLAVSIVAHAAAAASLLALPQHPVKASPDEVAVVFLPAPKLSRLERPRPAAPPPLRTAVTQRRTGARLTKAIAFPPSPLPARREPETQPRPIVMRGLTIQATARAATSDVLLPSSGALGGVRSEGSDPAGGGGVGRLVDAGEVTEPPAVVARAELRRFYPPEAMKNGFEGDVKLRLLVAQDGTLAQVDVVRDPGEGLGAAGARAIRSFRFRPARLKGEAVATIIHFTLHFVLG